MSDKAIYTIELNDRLSPGLKKAVANSIGFDKQMGKTRGGLGRTTKSMGGASKGLGAMGGMFTKLLGPIAIASAALKAFSIASDSIRAARNFESLENAINFASGSAEAGAKNMAFLRETADQLGTDLLSSTEGFKQFSAAALGTKLQGEKTNRIFKQVSMATTAMGLSAENSKGVFLALSQMMSKGKVSSEELRQQLGERLPGAMKLAAKAVGVSGGELEKMLQQGKIGAEEFLPRFGAELEKTFGRALPKAVNSSQAQLNRFNNTFLELKLKLGKVLLPVINKVMSVFVNFFNFLMAHKTMIIDNVINPMREAFKVLFEALAYGFGFIHDGFGESITMGQAFRAVLKGLGLFIKNVVVPYYKVFGRVVGFIFGGVLKFQLFVIDSIIKAFQNLFATIKYVFTFIKEEAIGLGEILKGAFTLDSNLIGKGFARMKGAGAAAAQAFSETMAKDLSASTMLNNLKKKLAAFGGSGAEMGDKKETALTGKNQTFGKFNFLGGGTDGKGGKQSSTSVDGIKSGRPTHINIDIGKLIENMNITATDVEDLTGQIKDQVAQALFSAVNNVNNIAGV